MKDPEWLNTKLVLGMHDEQIAAYGGLAGVRDLNLLESALAKPKMAWAYEDPQPDLPLLAALYMTGIARNHPFNDANKRTSLVSGLTFLRLQGLRPRLDRAEIIDTMLTVADGSLEAKALADWLRGGLQAR